MQACTSSHRPVFSQCRHRLSPQVPPQSWTSQWLDYKRQISALYKFPRLRKSFAAAQNRHKVPTICMPEYFLKYTEHVTAHTPSRSKPPGSLPAPQIQCSFTRRREQTTQRPHHVCLTEQMCKIWTVCQYAGCQVSYASTFSPVPPLPLSTPLSWR